jgi:hypothetical protein
MFHFPVTPRAFEVIREDLGPDRSPLAPIRTAAHAACARRHARQKPSARQVESILAAILGGEVARIPASSLRHRS